MIKISRAKNKEEWLKARIELHELIIKSNQTMLKEVQQQLAKLEEKKND